MHTESAPEEEGRTLVINSVEVASVTLIHPPTRAILFCTVPFKLIIVIVPGTELHAIVGSEELVTGIITKIIAIEGIAGISADEVGVGQAVFVGLGCHPERGIVCSAVR